jgi:hypothetical protein
MLRCTENHWDKAGWVHRVFLSVDGVQWDEHDVPATSTWVD